MSKHQRIANMTFASVYPHYVNKITKKGRKPEDLHIIIEWLTGYNDEDINKIITNRVIFQDFFDNASLNKNVNKIKGVICGCRIEDIEDPVIRKVRYLDKLVDELAQGKNMDSILRK